MNPRFRGYAKCPRRGELERAAHRVKYGCDNGSQDDRKRGEPVSVPQERHAEDVEADVFPEKGVLDAEGKAIQEQQQRFPLGDTHLGGQQGKNSG